MLNKYNTILSRQIIINIKIVVKVEFGFWILFAFKYRLYIIIWRIHKYRFEQIMLLWELWKEKGKWCGGKPTKVLESTSFSQLTHPKNIGPVAPTNVHIPIATDGGCLL